MNSRIVLSILLAAAVLLVPTTSSARYLNTGAGRFQTMDSFQGNNEDPLGLHKYLYCQNNPVNNLDPSGLNTALIFEYYGTSPKLGMPGHAVVVVDNPAGGVEVFGFHALSWDLQEQFGQGPYVRFFFVDTGYVSEEQFASTEDFVKDQLNANHGVVVVKFAFGSKSDDMNMISYIQDTAQDPPLYSILLSRTCIETAEEWFNAYLHGDWKVLPVLRQTGNGLLPSWALPGSIYLNPGVAGTGLSVGGL